MIPEQGAEFKIRVTPSSLQGTAGRVRDRLASGREPATELKKAK